VSADNLQTRWPYCDNGIEELFGQRKLWIDISGRSHQLEEMEQSYLDTGLSLRLGLEGHECGNALDSVC
jgi:hypothetical protein